LNTQVKRYVKVFISLLVGVLILWLITRGQDVPRIMEEFRHANYGWILLAMLCALLSHFLRAVRWNMLIRTMGYKTNNYQTFLAVMTGYLSNLAIPRMGEITRCVTLSKASKTPFNALAGTVLAERAFDLFSMLAIVFITIAGQFSFLRNFLLQTIWAPTLERGTAHWLLISIVTILFLALIIILILFLRKNLYNPREGSFFFRLKRQMHGFSSGVSTIKDMRGKGWFVLHTLLIWGLYYLTVYLCFFAIQATSDLTALAGLTLLAVGSLGILAPVPGGIGTYHFLTIITLRELYGIASEPATSYAYITHATQIVVNITAGTFAWIMLSLKKQNHDTQQTSAPDGKDHQDA